MSNFFGTLKSVLLQCERLAAQDASLLQNAALELGNKMDEEVLTLLYNNEETRKHFFTKINDFYVFDKQKFAWVVNNRQFLPDSYTRFCNKIGLVDNREKFISTNGDVVLSFPYKDCLLEGGQTKDEQKRQEVMWNEILSPDEVDRLLEPKAFCNAARYMVGGKTTVTELNDTDHLIIKGNNLLAIMSLLRRYAGKVKCIYIDPPYNPESQANTFCYNNTFNRAVWLVFMKNRLEIAKRLLARDGVLIVAIDKNEQPRLQILIEEIFTEHAIDCVTIIHNPRGTIGTNFSYTHEYAIFATPKGMKSINDRKLSQDDVDWSPLRNWGGESLRTDAKNCFYPVIVKNNEIVGFGDVCPDDFHPQMNEEVDGKLSIYPIDCQGIERKWRYARQTVDEIKHLLRVRKSKNGFDIELGKDFGIFKTVWTDSRYDASTNGTQLLKEILPGTTFTYPKSLYNVLDCVESVVKNDKEAIILDFFGGSGTTGHAVMEINKDGGHRRFILVEQMDYIGTDTLPRCLAVMKKMPLVNSGIGIVYCELAQLNAAVVKKIGEAKTEKELRKIWNSIQASGYYTYKLDSELADKEFDALSIENKKTFLVNVLDKNLLYVNYSEMDDTEFALSEEDKEFSRKFYEK